MKKVLLFLLALVMFRSVTYSQTVEKNAKIKAYKITVKFVDKSPPLKGYLHSVTDSSIVVIPTNNKYEILADNSFVELPIKEIKKIKKSIKREALIGAMPGFVGGAIFGGIAGAFNGNAGAMILYAGIFGTVGASITSGLTVLFAGKKYRISGDTMKYRTKYMLMLKEKAINN